VPRQPIPGGNEHLISIDKEWEFRVLISGICSSGFDLDLPYKLKVYSRLYSYLKHIISNEMQLTPVICI
jgi:hypothetical protein